MMKPVADWTTGTETIAYQACGRCGHVQYFQRAFCATCGAADPEIKASSGQGVVYAATTVHRAATSEAKAHVPYALVLVDMVEGFRMMAHGALDLKIDDRVSARFAHFTDHIVPYFERMSP